MKTTFIWDLDGTLIDSYAVILQALNETFIFFNIPYERETIKNFILNHSVVELLKQTALNFSLPYEDLKSLFSKKTRSNNKKIILMEGALDILRWTKTKKITNFIYTHKSDNALNILNALEIDTYFAEVITSSNGFQRKPSPEAIHYLIAHYQLNPATTYYIGDRALDLEVAINAGIKSLNLSQPNSNINQQITKLTDISYLTHLK